MKLRNYILVVGAILALAIPAAATASVTGGGSITHTVKAQQPKADSHENAVLKRQIKLLKAKLAKAEAKRDSLAYDNSSLNRQVNDLWAKVRELQNIINPPIPQVLTPHDECVYSGNNCTQEELCTIWGYGGCDNPLPIETPLAQNESSTESTDAATTEQ